jgi:hypothetical protein
MKDLLGVLIVLIVATLCFNFAYPELKLMVSDLSSFDKKAYQHYQPIINDNMDEIVDGIKWAVEALDRLFNLSNKEKIREFDERIKSLNDTIEKLVNPGLRQKFSDAVNEFFGHDKANIVDFYRSQLLEVQKLKHALVRRF